MVDPLSLIAAFAGGAAAAAVFLLLLWRSIRHLLASRRAGAAMAAYFLLRHGIVASSFYAIHAAAGWMHLLVALSGFTAVRVTATACVSRGTGGRTGQSTGGGS